MRIFRQRFRFYMKSLENATKQTQCRPQSALDFAFATSTAVSFLCIETGPALHVCVCECEFSRRSLFGQFKETRSLARRRRRKMFVALSLNKPGQLTLFTLLLTLFLLLPKQRRSATADPVPSSKSNNNKPNFPPSLSCGIYGERGAADRAVGQVDGNDNKSHANTKTIQLLQLSPS